MEKEMLNIALGWVFHQEYKRQVVGNEQAFTGSSGDNDFSLSTSMQKRRRDLIAKSLPKLKVTIT
jgi:hypothetical protein